VTMVPTRKHEPLSRHSVSAWSTRGMLNRTLDISIRMKEVRSKGRMGLRGVGVNLCLLKAASVLRWLQIAEHFTRPSPAGMSGSGPSEPKTLAPPHVWSSSPGQSKIRRGCRVREALGFGSGLGTTIHRSPEEDVGGESLGYPAARGEELSSATVETACEPSTQVAATSSQTRAPVRTTTSPDGDQAGPWPPDPPCPGQERPSTGKETDRG
jgi:hypothetical protein